MAYVKKNNYITMHRETVQRRRKKYKLCQTCKYRTTRANELNNGMLCNYIGITGKMRGCKAEHCIRYEKGKHEKQKSTIVLLKQINKETKQRSINILYK